MHQEEHQERSDEALIEALDATHVAICARERRLFSLIRQAEGRSFWRNPDGTGAKNLGAWLSERFSITWWKANRWIGAAHALEDLPHISRAFETGRLGIDKVVELTRLATPETEARLIEWAVQVSGATIRRKAELVARKQLSEVREVDRSRSLQWWVTEDDQRFHLLFECPSHQGPAIISAINRETEQFPVMPGEEGPHFIANRRADAFIGLCSARIGQDPDPDRATVVIHVSAETLMGTAEGSHTNQAQISGAGPAGPQLSGAWAEMESGPVLHPEVARGYACSARIQAVIEDACGQAVAMGRVSREPSRAIMRLLRHRDRGCVFCGSTRFLHAHHIRWWSKKGRTDLANLILVCSFHHKLVHEYGWRVTRTDDGTLTWYRPDGTLHRFGPSPPREPVLVS